MHSQNLNTIQLCHTLHTHFDITLGTNSTLKRAATLGLSTWVPVITQSEDTFLFTQMFFGSKYKVSPHEGPLCMLTDVAQLEAMVNIAQCNN